LRVSRRGCFAVGRESAETVVFLYGLGAQNDGISHFLTVLVLGIAGAFATFWRCSRAARCCRGVFFRVSEILLLPSPAGCSSPRWISDR
jgi:high-affinity iron transporter